MKRELEQVSQQSLKQVQRLILSPQMQQALHLLQLPILEINTLIEEELVQNPLLEYTEGQSDAEIDLAREADLLPTPRTAGTRADGDDLSTFIENRLAYENSLFDTLMQQARDTFTTDQELKRATLIIGNLDADGLLTTSVEEIALLEGEDPEALEAIVEKIQTFEPKGVAARSFKEALLIQLKERGGQGELAFRIVDGHFDDVLHNKLPRIAQALETTTQQVREAIVNEIAPLDLRPAAGKSLGHYKESDTYLTPDITISRIDGAFRIEVNEAHIRPVRFNSSYLKMLEDRSLPGETRDYIEEKLTSGKWLLRNLHERFHTLYRIAEQLIAAQKGFFTLPKGDLIPLTMKEIAEKLELHESTVARAVANKNVACHRGVIPLRAFFTHAYTSADGEAISSKTVKELVKELIADEHKERPLSDEQISGLIKEKGIECARRTVAKYRRELNIGNTSQRRLHC